MKRRGFTYIELMTVWAIISILAAILFPVFTRAKEKAYQCNCLRNLMSIGVALRVYAQDNYGHFPPGNNDFSPLLVTAMPDARVLVCPSAAAQASMQLSGTIPPEPAPGHADYVYWGGACDDDRPNFAIASDDLEGRHNTGANYLFVDGHVKWVGEDNAIPMPPGPGQSASNQTAIGGGAELQRLREMKPGYVPDTHRGESRKGKID
jgi:prepilin-type processing-associated H-X9-DG protein/prepilin-type N-terminal cleavage/methylation domain-containing protein